MQRECFDNYPTRMLASACQQCATGEDAQPLTGYHNCGTNPAVSRIRRLPAAPSCGRNTHGGFRPIRSSFRPVGSIFLAVLIIVALWFLGIIKIELRAPGAGGSSTDALVNVVYVESPDDSSKDFQFFNVTTGVFSSDSTQKHSGARSIRLDTGAAPGAEAYVEREAVVGKNARISFYVRFTSFPDNPSTIMKVGNAVGDGVFAVGVTPAGNLRLLNWDGDDVFQLGPTGSHQLSPGTWYRICLAYRFTDAAHYNARVFLNGADEIAAADSPALVTVGPALARWGWVWSKIGFGAGKVLNIDHIYIDNDSSCTDAGA